MTIYEKYFIRQQRMAHFIIYIYIYIYIHKHTHTHTYIHILTLKNLAFCSHSIIMGIVLFTQWAMIISLTAVTGVSPLWIEDVHYIR